MTGDSVLMVSVIPGNNDDGASGEQMCTAARNELVQKAETLHLVSGCKCEGAFQCMLPYIMSNATQPPMLVSGADVQS